MPGLRKLFQIAAVVLAGAVPARAAGPDLALGPVPIALVLKDKTLSASVELLGSLVSQQGVVSADGYVDVTLSGKDLAALLQSLAAPLLPQTFTTARCVITLKALDVDKMESVSNELRISLTTHLQLERCLSSSVDAGIMLPVIPQRVDVRTIRLTIPRNPEITLPWWARVASSFVVRDLGKLLRDKIEPMLRTDPRASLVIPTAAGVRAAFQGASIKGSGEAIVLHVVGDVHVDDNTATAFVTTRWNPLRIDLGALK